MRNKRNRPKTWMLESVLATFLCLPAGIMAIMNARKVNFLFKEGEYEEAKEASNDAKKWVLTAVSVGIFVFFSVLIICMFFD